MDDNNKRNDEVLERLEEITKRGEGFLIFKDNIGIGFVANKIHIREVLSTVAVLISQANDTLKNDKDDKGDEQGELVELLKNAVTAVSILRDGLGKGKDCVCGKCNHD